LGNFDEELIFDELRSAFYILESATSITVCPNEDHQRKHKFGDQKLKKEGEFDKTFRKTVDDVLNQIFGHAAALIIYHHLEKNDSLTPGEIPKKLNAFAKGLEDFLDSGAFVVEGIILEHLYSSYGFEFKKMGEGRSFVDYIIQLRSKVNENTKIMRKT